MILLSWTTVLLLCLQGWTKVNGQDEGDETGPEIFRNQLEKFALIEPNVDNSCYVTQKNKQRDLYVICPTEVDCYVKAYESSYLSESSRSSTSNSQVLCKSMDGEPFPVDKSRQLNGVLQFLRLSNGSACEFSSVETLSVNGLGVANSGILNNDTIDASKCPSYNLKLLSLFHLKMERVSNNSLSRLGQLRFLWLFACGITSIDEDAFAHLVNLEVISLSANNLTHLPAKLFASNVHLINVHLNDNQLLTPALNALFAIDSLKILILAENRVNFSAGHVTFPLNLQTLDVANNDLRGLKLELANLNRLEKLKVSNNSVSEVDENAFQDLWELKLLNLDWNKIEQLFEDTFESNLNLETLSLKGNKLRVFPPIAHLASLKYLRLSNNKIGSLLKTHLSNCSQLSYVDLTYNQLSFIEEGSFLNARRLEKLYLDHNHLSEMSVNFQSSSVSVLSLGFNNFTLFSYSYVPRTITKLSLSSNQIASLQPFDFNVGDRSAREWNLIHLDLSRNRIESTRNLTLPLSIRSINLNSNQLEEAFSLSDAKRQKLYSLTYVFLQGNRIISLCSSSFSRFNSTAQIRYYVGGNPLACTSEMVWFKYHPDQTFTFADLNQTYCRSMVPYADEDVLERLDDLSYYHFFSRSDHEDSYRCLCPPQYDMECELPCPFNCTCYSDYTIFNIILWCPNRQFASIPNNLTYADRYKATRITLELGGNFFPHVGRVNFGVLNENIDTLGLSNCNVTSVDNHAFDLLTHLLILHLSNNRLETLPDGLFRQLAQLISLHLSNNRLTCLAEDAFHSLVSLESLYLHNNSLNRLQLDQFTPLKSLNIITLHDNPWSCDCAFLKPFHTFLDDNSSAPLLNKEDVNCTENGQQFNIPEFYQQHCFTQLIYLDQSITSIITITFAIVLTVTIILIFKWRYELQVLIYSHYGLRMFRRKKPDEEMESKQYDAFLTYESEDEGFVVNELMARLEGAPNSFRLCVQERDFPVGSYIQGCIIEAVRRSCRTIIVLSENYGKRGWSQFVFKHAHAQMLEDQCPRLLVIVHGEIPKTLDPEVKLYLETNTYLKWGEKLFWQKLNFAMPDQRVTTPPSHFIPMQEL